MQSNAISNLELGVSRTDSWRDVDQLTGWTLVAGRELNSWQVNWTLHYLPNFLNGNLVTELQTFMRTYDRYDAGGGTARALQPSRRRTQQVSRRWCQLRLTRDKTEWKIIARARTCNFWMVRYCNYILHRSEIGPLHGELKSRKYRSCIRGPVANFVTAISCRKASMMRLFGGELIPTISIYV